MRRGGGGPARDRRRLRVAGARVLRARRARRAPPLLHVRIEPGDAGPLRGSVGLPQLLRQTDGPLTRDLLRTPGRFGLGQVPMRLAPDATARLVCGYCSTGCRLTAHLRDGEAVNLSPDPDYSVNLWMACPKGWQALAPLDADDRLTTPLVRIASGGLAPASWDAALRDFVRRFRGVAERHGPEAMAFLSTGQIATEEMVYLGALAKFGM